VERISP
jgi:hypothetical protein